MRLTGALDSIATAGRRPTLIALAVAAVAGSLWWLASPRFDLWPLAWIAPAPLVWLIDRAPTPKRARRYAWLAGTVCSIGGFGWIVSLLTRYSSFPWPLAVVGLVLLAAYQGLIFWAFAAAVRRVREVSRERLGAPLPMALLAPVAMVCFETAWPLIFPYQLAITQAWNPSVIQIAELTGPVGVTALLFAVGGALYDALTAATLRRRAVPAGAALALVAASLIYGHVRIGQIDEARAAARQLRVGLVQTNVPFDGPEPTDGAAVARRLQQTHDRTAELEARGAELVVWPESGFPFALERLPVPGPAEQVLRHRPVGDDLEDHPAHAVPLVAGVSTIALDRERGTSRPPYNSALLLQGGRVTARYDKNYLVMFSEHIPFADTFPSLAEILPTGTGHFSAGDEVSTLALETEAGTVRLGPMICFEDTLPAFSRRLAEHHPHLLVNLTNDTWFGDGSEPRQHLALSVFRAVELRTELVRAVNTGVTAHVDAAGRVRTRTEVIDPRATPREPEAVLVTVALLEGGYGFFARFGRLFGFLCVIATLGAWLGWPRVRRRA